MALLIMAAVPLGAEMGTAGATHQAPPVDAWVQAAQQDATVELVLGGDELTLALTEDADLLAPELHRPGLTVIDGHVPAVEGSWLTAVAHNGALDGVLRLPGTLGYTIAPGPTGELLVEPAQASQAPGPIQRIDSMDLIDADKDHFGCLHPTPTPIASPASILGGWDARTFDIAFTVDRAFVDRHGPSWEIKALSLASTMDALYDRYIDLDVRVADFHVHDFDGTNTGALLSELASHYRQAHPDLPRENTHLFTGKTLQGDAVGQASCIGGAGDPNRAFTVSQADDCGSGSLILVSVTTNPCIKIAAHELGHILSAHHHYSNCAESLLVHDPGAPADACTLMINAVNLATGEVSTFNRLAMRGWADQEEL